MRSTPRAFVVFETVSTTMARLPSREGVQYPHFTLMRALVRESRNLFQRARLVFQSSKSMPSLRET